MSSSRVRRPRSAVVTGTHLRHPAPTSPPIRKSRPQTSKPPRKTPPPPTTTPTTIPSYMRPTTQSARRRRRPSSSTTIHNDSETENGGVIESLSTNHALVHHVFSRIRQHCGDQYGHVRHAFDRFISTRSNGRLTRQEVSANMSRVLGLDITHDECALIMHTLAASKENRSTQQSVDISELAEAVRLSRTPQLFSQFLSGQHVLKYGDASALEVPSMFRVTSMHQPVISEQAREFMRQRRQACVVKPAKRRQNNHLRSDSRLLGSHPDEFHSRYVDDEAKAKHLQQLHTNRLRHMRQQRQRLDDYARERQLVADAADARHLHHHRAQYHDWMARIHGDQHDQGWLILHSNRPLKYKYKNDPNTPLAIPHW